VDKEDSQAFNKGLKNIKENSLIIKIYKPRRIIIKKLDFRSPELSKRMNRIV
jgi:hypothetical protein